MDGGDDDEDIFPPELDEFLEYCVGEHGNDFESISKDFLDIAVDLEESLTEHAQDLFSPASLRLRWSMLCEAAGVEDPLLAQKPAEQEADAGNTSDAKVLGISGAEEVQIPGAVDVKTAALAERPRTQALSDGDQQPNDEYPSLAPSGFSIFASNLKEQIGKIYNEVQNKLPSVDGSSGEENSDDDVVLFTAPSTTSLVVSNAVSSHSLEQTGSKQPVCTGVGMSAFTGLMPTKATSSDDDDSKDLMDLAESDELREQAIKLFGTDNLDQILTSMSKPVPPDVGPAVSVPFPAGQPDSPQEAPGTNGTALEIEIDEGANDSDNDEESDDSIDVDFTSMRRTMKTSSLEMVTSSDPAINHKFAPPPRTAEKPKDIPKAPVSKTRAHGQPQQQFRRLELQEESDSDSDDGQQPNIDLDLETMKKCSDDEDELEEDEALKVSSHLLNRAPNGECSWDVWLDMMRRWPKLQVAVGSPDFFRRATDLRVRFNVDKLQETRTTLVTEAAEKRRQVAEKKEKLQNGVEEFIREAEKRREMMNSRFKGGFVLAQSRQAQEIEEGERKREQYEEAEKERQLNEERQRAKKQILWIAQNESKTMSPEERQRRQQEEAEEAEKLKQAESQNRRAELSRLEQRRRFEEAALKEKRSAVDRMFEESQSKRLPLCDRQASFGVSLPGLAPEIDLSDVSTAPSELYVLPWGPPGGGIGCAPQVEQRELLASLHECGLIQALLLVSVGSLTCSEAAKSVAAYASAVVVIVSTVSHGGKLSTLFAERLPCGKIAGSIASSPWPLSPLIGLFKRPLAIWAHEEVAMSSKLDQHMGVDTFEMQTVCVALLRATSGFGGRQMSLSAVISDAYEEGISVVGMRMIFPDDKSAQSAPSAALRSSVRGGQPLMLLALRGPHALSVWRSMLGPADPLLARRTDPESLNARFGGLNRNESLAAVPPSSLSRAQCDVAWAFGGRLDSNGCADVGSLRERLHAISIPSLVTFAIEFPSPIPFSSAGSILGGLQMRLGHVVSAGTNGRGGQRMVVVAIREGGDVFLSTCSQLICEPVIDFQSLVARIDAQTMFSGDYRPRCAKTKSENQFLPKTCEVPDQCGLSFRGDARAVVSPATEEAWRLGDPEVLIVAIRPAKGEAGPLLLREVLEGLYLRFGAEDKTQGAAYGKAEIDIGGAMDLVDMRMLDFNFIPTGSLAAKAAVALKGLRNFSQMLKRTTDEASDGWWLRDGASGPATLLCFRGESAISRFSAFLVREWKLPGATGGDVLFSPNINVSLQVYNMFFSNSNVPAFEPTFHTTDLRAPLRFHSASEELGCPLSGFKLSEADLFPARLSNQCTVALVASHQLDAVLHRVLNSCEQNEFTVVSAIMSGGLDESLAKQLFDQEVSDQQLEIGDWQAFYESVGCQPGMEDSGPKHIWLLLARHQAIKKFAQLCGHGDPQRNKNCFRVSLRAGRDRINNGIRCATSPASAKALVTALGKMFSDKVVPQIGEIWPPPRSIGVEESERLMQCCLVVLGASKESGITSARALRDFWIAAAEQELEVVALRTWDQAPQGVCEAAWMRHPWSMTTEQFRKWLEVRPSAKRVVELGNRSGCLIMAAIEGPAGCSRARTVLTRVAAAAPSNSIEWYASNSMAEVGLDVAVVFKELHGKHYMVECDA